MKKQLLISLSLAASASLMAAPAVSPINSGDILRQVEPVKLPAPEKGLPSVGVGEYKAPLEAKDTVKIFVKSFKFSGNTVFASEVLDSLVKPYEGKELGINGLKEVASVITKYYRDHGYFVARAYIPAQAMEEGVVEIAVIEGNYGSFDMKNSSLVDTDQVQGFMDYLKAGQIVSTMSLERQMLLINDLAGAQVSNAEVYPGKAVGTSDFRITVDPTAKYSSYTMADNYGSRYTGESRLNVGSTINSLTGIGDSLSLTGLISNTTDLKNARFAYERPLGYSGLKGGASFSTTGYRLSDELSYLNAYGRINTLNAYLSYPLIKTRSHTLSTDLSYDHRGMHDSLSGNESRKKIDALTLRINDKRNTAIIDLPGSLYASLGVTTGHLGLGSDTAHTNDTLMHTEGNYAKATINAYHTQYLNPLFNLQTTFKGQKSFGKNLDSSENLSVGGSNGVRAYEDNELSGNEGYALAMDLLYALPPVNELRHTASVFIDHAHVWKNTTIFNTEDNTRVLNAIGLGWSGSYKQFDMKATYAHGFGTDGKPTAEAATNTCLNKFLIQGIYRF